MTFDVNKPGDDDYVIDLCADIRNNFNAIQTGTGGFSQNTVVLGDLTKQNIDLPQSLPEACQLFCKTGNNGQSQLFFQNTQGLSQLTTVPSKILYDDVNPKNPPTHVLVSLPGGLIMKSGFCINYKSNKFLPLTEFSKVFSCQVTLAIFNKSQGYSSSLTVKYTELNSPELKVFMTGKDKEEFFDIWYLAIGLPQ